ncbi:hypothetical protein N9Z54_03000 [Planctomycetota bacterium]|nr:hypothetical protein [Planctomycetota bacterium]
MTTATDRSRGGYRRIESRADFLEFLRLDLSARSLTRVPWLCSFRRPLVAYTVKMRQVEYLQSKRLGFFGRCWLRWRFWRLKMYGGRLGLSMVPGTFGPGLVIVHHGSIVISSKARFGSRARIHSCVNVSGAPVFGDDVYLGPGAVVVGDVDVGDRVRVGANSVVSRTVKAGSTVLGVPARVIKVDPIAEDG